MSGVDHIAGHTYHGRKGDIRNAFRYAVDFVLLDAETVTSPPRLFSRNSRNLLSVWDSDHGGPVGKGRGPRWARDVLAQNGFAADGRLELLAQPRVLGHVFNPVSFWLSRDKDGALIAVIAEVTNTFGDRHSYLCAHPDKSPILPTDTLKAAKVFHVSPFQPVEGEYRFRFDIRPDHIGIHIHFASPSGGVIATLSGPRKPLNGWGILAALVKRPFGTRRVLTLIHWQAARLWWKGARYRTRPAPPSEEVTQ